MLNIVFASDANYAPFTAVTLASALRHYRHHEPVRVFLLLDQQLDAATKSKFDSLQQILPHELNQIVVDASAFDGIRTSDGISIATYYRLLMHHLLPDDCHKAIYLDSDMIVKDCLGKLIAESDFNALFSGVQDSISRSYNRKFGLPVDAHHVNAGVLVVNVDKMRKMPFDRQISDYLQANRYRITLGDQQIIAELYHNQISYVSPRWNVHGSMFLDSWVREHAGVQNSFTEKEVRDASRSPAIIHYTLKRKPWISLEHPRSLEWFEYLKLTDFRAEFTMPSKRKSMKSSEPETSEQPLSINSAKRFFRKIVPATWKSLTHIRKTRLKVDRISNDVEKLSSMIMAGSENALEKDIRLKRLLIDLSRSRPEKFNAAETVKSLNENSVILSNVKEADIDGGYAENIKTLFRTNRIGFNFDSRPSVVALLSQRVDQEMFWHCLNEAYLYDIPTLFVEVALFGGYAGFFDQSATLNERRAFGFLVDDMGYYFDCRQPSRFERTLNSPDFSLSPQDESRVRNLIQTIIRYKITKYNKYAIAHKYPLDIDPNSVLVVDQKRGDASIQFARANDESFRRMMEAAVAENPGKTIYFKRHPDSVHRNYNSYRNRNIKEISVLPDEMPIDVALERCDTIYTVSSQIGFEGLLRGKNVVCFGVPFYAGWGLTDDRQIVPRRRAKRTIEEIFHQICIEQSVYLDAATGQLIELEEAVDLILQMRGSGQRRRAA